MKKFLLLAIWLGIAFNTFVIGYSVAQVIPRARPIEASQGSWSSLPLHAYAMIASGPPADTPFPHRLAQFPVPSRSPEAASTSSTAAVAPVAPVTVTTVAPTDLFTQILMGVWTAIGTLLAGFSAGALNKYRQTAGSAHAATAGTAQAATIQDVVNAVLHPSGSSIIGDITTRQEIDRAILAAVQSGVPGSLLNTAAGFIPGGAGGFVTMLEPTLRKIVSDALTAKLGTTTSSVVDTTHPAVPAPQLDIIKDLVTNLTNLIENRFPKPPGSTVTAP